MTWVSLALLAFGVADLVRARPGRMPLSLPPLAGVLTLVALSIITDVHRPADIAALVVTAVALTGWVVTSAQTQATGRRAGVPLALIAVLLGGLVAFSGFASTPGGPLADWLSWADLPWSDAPPSVARALLLAGLVLLNIATGNVVVRLVLLGHRRAAVRSGRRRPRLVGRPPASRPAQGWTPARPDGAARHPRPRTGWRVRRRQHRHRRQGSVALPRDPGGGPHLSPPSSSRVGIDDVTEYFLVGSFVSWLVALGSLALAR